MNNKKVLFIDIDETLVDNESKTIPESALYSLEQLYNNGVDLVIASGRNITSINHISSVFKYISGFVMINGQCLIHNNEVIYDKSLPFKDTLEMFKYGVDNNLPIGFVCNKDIYVTKLSKELEDMFKEYHLLVPTDMNNEYFKYDVKPKQCWFLVDHNQYKKEDIHFENFDVVDWPVPFGYDLLLKGSSKRDGILKYIELLGYSKDNTYAIGDGDNDAEMLECVGCGIAMGNACERTKKAADYITDSVRNNGFYKACVKLLNIKENTKFN